MEDAIEQLADLSLRDADDSRDDSREDAPDVSVSLADVSLRDAATPRVVFNSACALHRFSRAASAALLATIFERPERLTAVAVGVAAAQQHTPVDVVVSTARSPLDSPHVTKVHGQPHVDRVASLCKAVPAALAASTLEVPEEWPSGDIYLGPESLAALEGAVATLEQGVDSVFAGTTTFVAPRPPGHHAHRDAPSGFCLLNNAHVAIQYAAAKHDVTHAVILDIDLHHGDGSQALAWTQGGWQVDDTPGTYNDWGRQPASPPHVAYLSLHDIHSFPVELDYATRDRLVEASVCVAGHGMCVWNVHLEEYTTDEEFDRLYTSKYSAVLHQARAWLATQTGRGLVVLSAGFDALEHENHQMQRHGVHVPSRFYHRFASDAAKLAQECADGHLLALLEGGYSDGALALGSLALVTGLGGCAWNPDWGSSAVVKRLARGCRDGSRKEGWEGNAVRQGRAWMGVAEKPMDTARISTRLRGTPAHLRPTTPAAPPS